MFHWSRLGVPRGRGEGLPFLRARGVCVLPLLIPVSWETDTRRGQQLQDFYLSRTMLLPSINASKLYGKFTASQRLTSYGNLLYDFISTTFSLVLFRPTQTCSSGLNILPSITRYFVCHGQTHQDTSMASKQETLEERGQVVRCWFETVLQLVQLSNVNQCVKLDKC